MYSKEQDEIKLHILINGKSKDYYTTIKVNYAVNTLKRLKSVISQSIRNKYSSDKMLIFNFKGLEVDEVDVEYLKNDQILFISQDGQPFISSNYLNQFEFVEYVKSGGYGKIYIAKNFISNELVAVKKIETNSLSSEEIYNISREAVYLESFKHKNIIKVHFTFLSDNVFYTVMELAKGGELSGYLKENKYLVENEAKKIFKQIHDAVKYIHSKNVIHRDLNPFNILFKDKDRENILLIDFGISGYNSGNIKEKINAGTIRFIPPEVASGSNLSSNPKIDNWALGVILYLMLFGKYPFDGNSDMEIINEISSQNIKFPNNIYISKTCKLLLTKFLVKDPNARLELTDDIFDTWYSEEFIDLKNDIENNFLIKCDITDDDKLEELKKLKTASTVPSTNNPKININKRSSVAYRDPKIPLLNSTNKNTPTVRSLNKSPESNLINSSAKKTTLVKSKFK